MNKTQKKIFDAAIKVISASGYNKSTMDEIAENAGVAKGTLYYNFKSKEEIFNEIVKVGIEYLTNEIKEINSNEIEPIIKLQKICRFQLSFFYMNKDLVKVVLSQLWGDDNRQIELRNMIREYIEYIKCIIEDGIEHENIKKEDSLILAHAFFGSIVSTAIYDLVNANTENFENVINTTLNFTLKGIGIKIV